MVVFAVSVLLIIVVRSPQFAVAMTTADMIPADSTIDSDEEVFEEGGVYKGQAKMVVGGACSFTPPHYTYSGFGRRLKLQQQ